MSKLNYALAPLVALTFAACGGEDNHEENHANHEENHANHEDNNHANHEHGDVDEEACAHMANGPNTSVAAVADIGGALEDATAEHTRVDVTLAMDFEGQNGGYVRYEAAEAGDFVFFVDSDVAIALYDDADAEVPFEETGVMVDTCAEVAVKHVAELEAGASYKIELGPTDATEVRLVIEHGGEHEEE